MKPDARNPFYPMLLIFSVLFTATAFAYALVPWEAQPPWFQARGWQLILVELAAIIIFGLSSMSVDRLRSKHAPAIRNQESGIGNRGSGSKAPAADRPLDR